MRHVTVANERAVDRLTVLSYLMNSRHFYMRDGVRRLTTQSDTFGRKELEDRNLHLEQPPFFGATKVAPVALACATSC